MKLKNFFWILLAAHQCLCASLEIIQLSPERWQEYKALRLSALQADPEAFAIAVEDEAVKPDRYWQEKLENANKDEDNWLYFAQSEGKLVGMLGAFREWKDATYCTHLVTLTGMYVDGSMRGKGVGDRLIKHVLHQINLCDSNIVCMLWATTTKKAAIRLYERNGFIACGVLPQSIRIENKDLDCFLMYRMSNQN